MCREKNSSPRSANRRRSPGRSCRPGNVRELRNVIERAVILANGEILTLADLPEEFSQRPDPSVQVGARVSLEALEAEHVRRILAVSATLEDASRTLGIDPATLYRKRQKLGLS